MGQTEEIYFRYGPDGAVRSQFFPDYELGRTGPPLCEPGPSGPNLSWVEDVILGTTYVNREIHEVNSFFVATISG